MRLCKFKLKSERDREDPMYGVAFKKILERKSVSIEPVTTDMFPTTAQRPKNSALSLDKTRNTGFKPITWKEALSRLMNNM